MSGESLEEFLVYLADHCDPGRFYPFPEEYRKVPTEQLIAEYEAKNKKSLEDEANTAVDKKYVTITNGKVTTAKMSNNFAVDRVFVPYTTEEFQALKADLDKRSSSLINHITGYNLGFVEHAGDSAGKGIKEYEFRYSEIEERVRVMKYPKSWFMFHGSPLGNWHSIIRNGIRNMSGSRFMTVGQVYGAGVYLSNDLRTSYGYGGHAKIKCVSVVEIYDDPAKYDRGGTIFVVPDDSILVARYLLKIVDHPGNDRKDILEYYARVSPRKSSVIKKKRVEIELIELKCHAEIITAEYPIWTFNYKGLIFKIYFYDFPNKAPLIQSTHRIKDSNFEYYLWPSNEWSPKISVTNLVHLIENKFFKGDVSKYMPTEEALLPFDYNLA